MEAKFTAKHVWDVRAARALLRAAQKTPLWKIGAACAASGVALLAVCWALGARRLGSICFCVLALFGAYAAFGLEPMAARSLFTQRRRRWDAAALAFGEYKPRGGSAPITRFLLGGIAGIGALVFLGCPWRVILRLAGGDAFALFGLAGLICGVGIGTIFFRMGFSLGRSQGQSKISGLVLPGIMLSFVALYLLNPQVAEQPQSGVLFYSVKGPGAQHAPFILSIGVGLIVGFLAQRSRFCTMGALRDVMLFKQWHLALGFLAMLGAALVLNLYFGAFKPGFENQPIAQPDNLWNFLGMATAGLAFALAGGCPGRQLFMAGEGDNDAAVFAVGLIVGTAVAHNFGLASSPAGVGPHGMAATLAGLAICLCIGFFNCKRGA